MLSESCTFSGKVFLPWSDNQSIAIVTYEHDLGHKKNYGYNFKEMRRFKKLVDANVRWFGIANVGNIVTGLRTVILLVQYVSGRISVVSCTERSEVGGLAELMSFDSLPNYFAATNINISLTDGPTAVIIHESTAQIIFPLYNHTRSYDLQKFCPKGVSVDKILHFSCLGRYATIAGSMTVFILALLTSDNSSGGKILKILAIVQNSAKGFFYGELFNIGTDLFFSSHYHNILTAVYIEALKNTTVDTSEIRNLKDWVCGLPWHENNTIVCTEKQFLIFCSGRLKYCCSTPFSDVNCIMRTSICCMKFKNMDILLQSSSKGVCCMNNRKDSTKFQCAEVWTEAFRVLPGDFLKNGSKQLLLLFGVKFHTWQDSCIVVQLSTLLPIVTSEESEIPDEYLKNTIVGLQERVKCARTAVVNTQREIAQKTAAIGDVLKKVCEHRSEDVLDDETKSNSLVDIILYKDEAKHKCEKVLGRLKIALKVVEHWKTFSSKHWIIGWTLENVSDGCITNPTLTVLFETCEVQYKQRAFLHITPDLGFTSKDRRHIIPGEMLSVVAGLEIPKFTTDVIEALCVISWYIGTSTEYDNEIVLPENEKKLRHQQMSVQSNLSLKEVLNRGKFTECTFVQQLMSFRALQQRFLIHICAVNSDLTPLEEMLLHSDKFHMPDIKTLDKVKCLIFKNEASPLYSINMVWLQLNRKTVEAEVYVRDEKEAILLVQWLYNSLPCDIAVLPKEYKQREESHLKKKLLAAMKDELDILNAAFHGQEVDSSTLVLQSDDRQAAENIDAGTQPNCEIDQIILPKEAYLRVRKALSRKELITDNIVKTLPRF